MRHTHKRGIKTYRRWTEDSTRSAWRREAKRIGRAPTLAEVDAAARAGRTPYSTTLLLHCGPYAAFCRSEGYAPNPSGPKARRRATRDRRSALNQRESLDDLMAEGRAALRRQRQAADHNDRVKLHWLTTDQSLRDATRRIA